MAYQKLQGSKVLSVIPSDNNVLPTGAIRLSGTNAGPVVANQLIAAAGTFSSQVIFPGDVVYNVTDGSAATVINVVSDTALSLNADVFTATGKSFFVYRPEKGGAVLYIGGDGNVSVETADGSSAVFVGLIAGTFMPINVTKVKSTGTTATNIIAIW
jgi:hypothetical protein